jgi:D-serine deaminase-like pyridoxal phosphate-dependent protein
VISAHDEHATLLASDVGALPALGETLWLVPGHCDPTVNLYDWIVCHRQGIVEDIWPVDARGAFY